MALLIETNFPDWMTNEALAARLRPLLPNVDFRYLDDLGNREEIVMVVCSRLPKGLAKQLPNLRLVQKLGAGVETMVGDPDLPPNVRVTRLKPTEPAQEIAHYCVLYVLSEQRNQSFHAQNQQAKIWKGKAPRLTADSPIAVLGLGHIGSLVAKTFVQLGFPVIGWSRSQKQIDGVDCRAGKEAFASMLAESDYVCSVLPSTPDTRNLFNDETFALMKEGAMMINVGRGDLIDEAALVRALDSGRLSRAVLDVFQMEPLPEDSPLWHHPNVTITPHISGYHLGDSLDVVADNYLRLIEGRALLNLVDRELGY